jgi:hypothetical protein
MPMRHPGRTMFSQPPHVYTRDRTADPPTCASGRVWSLLPRRLALPHCLAPLRRERLHLTLL